MKPKITIGCDPELFLQNPNSGQFISAHDLVPGSKSKPFGVPYGAIQVDGTAAEININPAYSAKAFSHNIKEVMSKLREMVPGYNLVADPVVVFDQEYFDHGVPDTAKTLGCDPDFCGWTFCENPHPDPGSVPFRTGAGHVHIGWTEKADVWSGEHFLKCCEMAKQLDYYLGIWSLKWDKDPTRRQLYGKAGAFRPKPYGMEYRVMSNAWLRSSLLINWVYEASVAGANAFFNGGKAEMFHADLAQIIINNNELDWDQKYDLSDIDVPPLPIAMLEKEMRGAVR